MSFLTLILLGFFSLFDWDLQANKWKFTWWPCNPHYWLGSGASKRFRLSEATLFHELIGIGFLRNCATLLALC